MIVNPNERVQLNCGNKGDFRYCVWEKVKDIFQVEDVYEGVYSGMSRPETTEGNQCGIAVDQATTEDYGIWTCKIYIRGTTLVGRKNIVVTVIPTKAEVSPRQVTVHAGYLQAVECSVMAARPAVKIKWILNGIDITSHAHVEDKPTNPDGTYMTLSTIHRVFKPGENGHKLVCVVAHHTLAEPDITTVPITVVFAPIQKRVQTFYQIPLHGDYDVRLNFSCYPRPTSLKWSYGANFQEMLNIIQIPSDNGKLSTSLTDLENDHYEGLLRITEIEVEDLETMYNLYVSNEIGEANYRVMLSMDEEPVELLGSGAILAIIVALLLVVIAIGAAVYARYKEMFCFASGTGSKACISQEGGKTNNGNASDTIESPTIHINGQPQANNNIINTNGHLDNTNINNGSAKNSSEKKYTET